MCKKELHQDFKMESHIISLIIYEILLYFLILYNVIHFRNYCKINVKLNIK